MASKVGPSSSSSSFVEEEEELRGPEMLLTSPSLLPSSLFGLAFPLPPLEEKGGGLEFLPDLTFGFFFPQRREDPQEEEEGKSL